MTRILYRLTETRLGLLLLITSVMFAGWVFGQVAGGLDLACSHWTKVLKRVQRALFPRKM